MTTSTRLPTTPASVAPNWDGALCQQTDPDLFFPIGDNFAARAQAEQAKQICAECPLQTRCLSWALDTGQDQGVWGGMTELERRALHSRRSGTSWGRVRNVAERLFAERRTEFAALLAQGVDAVAVAAALGTNVQTVNRMTEMLAAEEIAEGVAA